ncbi:hypothetical protein Sjap_008130 [Stephania japonica]|uniref:Uncharacterized protein n=1 Tax=Stephania japonica TaxID=461633 RepID=A0AAP0JPR8_9MAGN
MASTTTTAHIIPHLEIPRGSGEAVELSPTPATRPGMHGGGDCALTRQLPSRDIIRLFLETEQDMNLAEQELDQWIEQRDQEVEEEIKLILQKISTETMSAIPLESVKSTYDEVEKDIEVVSERPEEPQKESKEDQPLVLVKLPTFPCIFVRPYKGVEVKERSQVLYTASIFVLDDQDEKESFVLEVSNELLILKDGVQAALPKYVDASFIVDISKRESIT